MRDLGFFNEVDKDSSLVGYSAVSNCLRTHRPLKWKQISPQIPADVHKDTASCNRTPRPPVGCH